MHYLHNNHKATNFTVIPSGRDEPDEMNLRFNRTVPNKNAFKMFNIKYALNNNQYNSS